MSSKSMVEQFEERGARIAELEKALQAAVESADLAKGQVVTLTQANESLKAGLLRGVKDLDEAKAAHEAQLAGVQKDRDSLQAKLTEAEGKLKLAPFQDVSHGTQPVPDGGAASDKKVLAGEDLIKHVESLNGHERMKFYRDNKEAVDAAYNERK